MRSTISRPLGSAKNERRSRANTPYRGISLQHWFHPSQPDSTRRVQHRCNRVLWFPVGDDVAGAVRHRPRSDGVGGAWPPGNASLTKACASLCVYDETLNHRSKSRQRCPACGPLLQPLIALVMAAVYHGADLISSGNFLNGVVDEGDTDHGRLRRHPCRR
jgi:hypothetical protein